jgi:hypothetical protein
MFVSSHHPPCCRCRGAHIIIPSQSVILMLFPPFFLSLLATAMIGLQSSRWKIRFPGHKSAFWTPPLHEEDKAKNQHALCHNARLGCQVMLAALFIRLQIPFVRNYSLHPCMYVWKRLYVMRIRQVGNSACSFFDLPLRSPSFSAKTIYISTKFRKFKTS